MGTPHLGGLLVTFNSRPGEIRVSAFAIPHWLLCGAFLIYPLLAFIRGPLRRYRRRRRGLCRECAYDLRGTTEPRCPECGKAFDAKK